MLKLNAGPVRPSIKQNRQHQQVPHYPVTFKKRWNGSVIITEADGKQRVLPPPMRAPMRHWWP
jgi:hypothetical protein